MVKTKSGNGSKGKNSCCEDKVFEFPPLPSLLTQPLGLEGWGSIEPVLLAALASKEPLLLVGPHGSAKSFLLERLAKAMELDYRFYNASLINYDDLVGIPIPDEERRSLRFITTPSAIWDAQVVFMDEINRTRPDLQNKLFPIIHERRVQGLTLEKLQYRWAAMNPPPAPDASDEGNGFYLGAEPLDTALADRFNFLIEVPGWQELSEEEKRRILRDQYKGEHAFQISIKELVQSACEHLEKLRKDPSRSLEDYLLNLLSQLEGANIRVSARRATMLHRNILAVHAARIVLYRNAYPELPVGVIDWNSSALIAVMNSLPQLGEGLKPDCAIILAAHRHAWEVSRLDADNPWRLLFQIEDPLERSIAAIEMAEKIDDDSLSQLILDGLASELDRGRRATAALAIYLAVHTNRSLNATVYETLAQEIRGILKVGEYTIDPDNCPRERYRAVKKVCAKLEGNLSEKNERRNRYASNLLMALISDGFDLMTPHQLSKSFIKLWDRIVVGPNNFTSKASTN